MAVVVIVANCTDVEVMSSTAVFVVEIVWKNIAECVSNAVAVVKATEVLVVKIYAVGLGVGGGSSDMLMMTVTPGIVTTRGASGTA